MFEFRYNDLYFFGKPIAFSFFPTEFAQLKTLHLFCFFEEKSKFIEKKREKMYKSHFIWEDFRVLGGLFFFMGGKNKNYLCVKKTE